MSCGGVINYCTMAACFLRRFTLPDIGRSRVHCEYLRVCSDLRVNSVTDRGGRILLLVSRGERKIAACEETSTCLPRGASPRIPASLCFHKEDYPFLRITAVSHNVTAPRYCKARPSFATRSFRSTRERNPRSSLAGGQLESN
ncbi:hypothetical protein PUN28_017174 [Cardiocondyla obscurior]|uniref:Uncharacterized protein n=1 Tax=Cardiocondyla obscurior TaxID=286306 RepID=A0AAW2EKM7_9HYME